MTRELHRRIRRLESVGLLRPPIVGHRSKADRDAIVAAATPADMQALADSLTGHEDVHRRAAVLAAMRADL